MDIKASIAKNISELRQKSGMTQLDFAAKLNYSDKAVSKWERGESLPDITVLAAIADLFGVTLDYLIHEEHAPQPLPETEESLALQKSLWHNHSIITCLGILSVWFVALTLFVLAEILFPEPRLHWYTFIYALPVSAVVWLVFNSVWFNRRRNYLIVSVLMWTGLLALCLSFQVVSNIWQLFSLGGIGQLVIFLCSRLKIVQTGEKKTIQFRKRER